MNNYYPTPTLRIHLLGLRKKTLGCRYLRTLYKITPHSANQIAQIRSCERSRIHVLTWVGRVSDSGKIAFIKKCKNLDNIAVYLITSLKSK